MKGKSLWQRTFGVKIGKEKRIFSETCGGSNTRTSLKAVFSQCARSAGSEGILARERKSKEITIELWVSHCVEVSSLSSSLCQRDISKRRPLRILNLLTLLLHCRETEERLVSCASIPIWHVYEWLSFFLPAGSGRQHVHTFCICNAFWWWLDANKYVVLSSPNVPGFSNP